MSKIIADRMMVDDDEMHFRDADAQNKLKNMIVQEKGNSQTAVMSQAAATAEFDKLSEAIVDLESTYLDDIKNLFDISKITEGHFVHQNTGVLSTGALHNASDFIGIKPNTAYTISVKSVPGMTNAQIRYAQYDDNKTFITGSGAVNITNYVSTFTSHENAKYVRISYIATAIDVMLEQGDTKTDYEPYSEPGIKPSAVNAYTKQESDAKYLQPTLFELNVPKKMYAQVGIEYNLWFDNIVSTHDTDYTFDITCSKGMQLQRCYRFTPGATDMGEYDFTVTATDKFGNTVSADSTLVISSADSETEKTVKMLILGDSTVANGIVATKIHTNFEGSNYTIETVGTLGTAPNKHEGRSGWSAGTYVGYAEVGGVTNPFYSNGFNAPNYFTTTGIDVPDWFIINLGINDMSAITADTQMQNGINTFVSRLTTMIDSIKGVNDSIKVGIAVTIPPNYSQDAFGKAYKCAQTRDRYKRNNFYLVSRILSEFVDRESERIYLIPIYTNLDTLYNMGFETIPVNARSTITYESPIGNGGIHPVESGYWQIADVYSAFIRAY